MDRRVILEFGTTDVADAVLQFVSAIGESDSPYDSAVQDMFCAGAEIHEKILEEAKQFNEILLQLDDVDGVGDVQIYSDPDDFPDEIWMIEADLVTIAEESGKKPRRSLKDLIERIDQSKYFMIVRCKLGRAKVEPDRLLRAIGEVASEYGWTLGESGANRKASAHPRGKARTHASEASGASEPLGGEWGNAEFPAGSTQQGKSARSTTGPARNDGHTAGERDFLEKANLRFPCRAEDLKSAHQKLALAYHPDRHRGDPRAHEQMSSINVAYQSLKLRLPV